MPADRTHPARLRLAPTAVRSSVAVLVLACVLPAIARAQSNEETSSGVHWAFGTFLGSGVYRISGERTVFAIQIPGRVTLQRSKIGQERERRIGIELRLPLTVGVIQGDSIDDFIDQDSYGTVAFSPGVEIEFPVTQDWLLRPYVYLGGGWELGDADDDTSVINSALIYQAGLKSRWHLPIDQGNWGLLSAVQYAGYNPREGPPGDLLIVMGGLETRQRLGSWTRGNHAMFIETHFSYNYVADLGELRDSDTRPLGIDDYWEVGLGISQGVVPFRVLGIPIERWGVAFQLSTDREYRAFKLSFRSPFER